MARRSSTAPPVPPAPNVPVIGNWQLAICNWQSPPQLAIGNWQLAIGNWQSPRNWQLAIAKYVFSACTPANAGACKHSIPLHVAVTPQFGSLGPVK
jgi:hypothetical protein